MRGSILCFNSRDFFLRLDVNHVAYVEAMGNYSKIVMLNGLKAAVRRTLADILNDFQSKSNCLFVRMGKSMIVNTSYVFLIDLVHGTLILSDGANFVYQIKVSKTSLKELKQTF